MHVYVKLLLLSKDIWIAHRLTSHPYIYKTMIWRHIDQKHVFGGGNLGPQEINANIFNSIYVI